MSERQRQLSEFTGRDKVMRSALGVLAVLPTAALVFLIYYMVKEAYPSIVVNGTRFFTHGTFNFGNQYASSAKTVHGYKILPGATYGVTYMLFGTVVSSVVAVILAVPVSVLGALVLVERAPRSVQSLLGIFLELLAGIPSVVFGIWGYLTFGPWLVRDIDPVIIDLHIPWFGGPAQAQSVFTASIVLAFMIVPIIASTTRELMRSVPTSSKEAAVAMGLTPSESARLVTLPMVRTGILAATILGLARAIGETIAVLMISGQNLTKLPGGIFASFASMAASIANLLDAGLTQPMGVNALAEVGLVLLVLTLATNFIGRLITSRLAGPGLPLGRGV